MKMHALNCPALSAWDIPGACDCGGRDVSLLGPLCRACGGSGFQVRSSWPHETGNMEQESCDACDGAGYIVDRNTPPAGRALDVMVAERVMGLVVCADDGCTGCDLWVTDGPASSNIVPRYSAEIASAWLVMDRMIAAGLRPSLSMMEDGRWICDGHWDDLYGDQSAPTAPLAICRAALAYFSRAALAAVEAPNG